MAGIITKDSRLLLAAMIVAALFALAASAAFPATAHAASANMSYDSNPKTAIDGGDVDVWMNDFTDYKVLSTENLSYDSNDKTYSFKAKTKTASIKIKYFDAGVMDGGEKADVVIEIDSERKYAENFEQVFYKPGNNYLSCVGWEQKNTVTVKLYKAGTSTRLTGKKFGIYFTDLDQPFKNGKGHHWEGEWQEGIELVSNYVNKFYSAKVSGHTNIGHGELNNHPWVHATHECENCKATWVSFIAKDGLKYIYRGCSCGTTVPLPKITPPKVTVKYHVNGGAIAGASTNATYNWKIVSSIVQFTKKTAASWSNCTSVVKRPETYKNLYNICSTGNANITRTGYHIESAEKYYYALYNDNKVYFHADDSTANTVNVVTTKRLNNGTQITTDKTVTLYVNWLPNNYTVTYDGNGATAGATANSAHTYDVARNLTANGYSRTGYEFKGWAATAARANAEIVDYQNSASVKNLTTTNGATVTLYAVWKPMLTYVELYVDDTTQPWDKLSYANTGQVWDVPADKTEGARKADCHHLDGTQGLDAWYLDPDYSQPFTPAAFPVGATIKLYARNWATVSFANGPASEAGTEYTTGANVGPIAVASGTPDAFEKPYGKQALLAEPLRTRVRYDAGSTFLATLVAEAGWHFDEACADAAFTIMTVSGDTTVYKKWLDTVTDGIAANAAGDDR